MEIRKKISLQFTLIVAILQILSSAAIYLAFAQAREDDLYARLEAKATSVGQLLIDIDEIDTTLLAKIERNNPMSLPDERVTIYDGSDSRVLFTNDKSGEIAIAAGRIGQVKETNRARLRAGEYEILGKLYRSGNTQVVVFVAAIDRYGFKKLAILRLILTLVFVIGLAMVYMAGRMFAGRAVQPILGVMEQVDRIGAGNLNARLDEGPNRDEIARLAATFNKLLARLESSFQMQKSFIANASHEMNTPLTVITGQLEVVLMKARTNEEYAEAIRRVLTEIIDLNQLSRKLLLLAQASTDLPVGNFAPIRIDDLLWQLHSELTVRNPAYSIVIRIDESIDEAWMLTLPGNEVLLKAALSNIVENGCKYSADHRVEVTVTHEPGWLSIHCADRGIGIPEGELGMIFEPFYRSRTARSGEGHGIGLSLAQKVVEAHNGRIVVSSRPGEGSLFSVRLPLAEPVEA